jgi:hypothetical protein
MSCQGRTEFSEMFCSVSLSGSDKNSLAQLKEGVCVFLVLKEG